ncbi:MAG: hypothetical protein HC912_09335 [Saprospiraceae bacterium]|nr:hypothetical protein [Saprospiraceae bacterium]
MYKNILPGIENVDWYGLFSLLIFFTFFVVMSIYVMRMSKKHIHTMENLPFEDSLTENKNTHEKTI